MTSPLPFLRRCTLWWTGGLAFALAALPGGAQAAGPAPQRVAFAVVGDSDSHSYQDTRAFPPGSPSRGGAYRATTYQWTDVLATLRGDRLDLGERGTWGMNGRLAKGVRLLGLEARAPRKVDHRYNFAVSGDGCEDLWGGYSRQVPSLIRLMDGEPERWRDGVVLIRIGVNTFGKAVELDRLARDPRDPAVLRTMDACVDQIRKSVDAISTAHPGTRIVLVGIFDNRHWAPYFDRWRPLAEQANISTGLDHFDRALQGLVAKSPRLAFFDDRAWFTAQWGGRDAQGAPAYRTVPFGALQVRNASGDEPSHAALADGHAGTAWNGLWARGVVDVLNRRFGLGIPALTDAELASLVGRPVLQR